MIQSDVRSQQGLPPASAFASAKGSPIVLDTDIGAAYAYAKRTAVGTEEVLELGARSGWNDMLASISNGRAVGGNVPTWAAMVGGIYGWQFSASAMNEIWVNMHIVHEYAAGTMIYPHIHWTTTGVATGVCRWGIEYSFANGFNSASFPATTTLYLQEAASGIALRHMITETVDAAAIGPFETDGILLMRIFRDAANVADTLTDPAFALFADLHYQSDGMLTNEKARGFTKRRGQL